MTTWRLIFVLLSASVLSGCAGGCGTGSDEKHIVILTNGESEFWDAAKKGALAAAKDLKLDENGYKLVIDNCDFKVDLQVQKLKGYAGSDNVVAVAVSVVDAENQAIAEALEELQEQGIKVITIDSDIDREKHRDARFAYLGSENFRAGKVLGVAVKNLRDDGGKYAAFVGKKSADNAQERMKGLNEGLGSEYQLTTYLEDGGRSEAPTRVKEAIDNNEGLEMLVGIYSYNTPAIIDVVKERENRDEFTIAAFDAEPQTIKGMEEGNVDVMVVQNPYQMGYKGVKLLKALLDEDQSTIDELLPNKGKTEDGDLHDTGLKVVVPEGVDKLSPEIFQKAFDDAEFGKDEEFQLMKLQGFRDWLKQYQLKGS